MWYLPLLAGYPAAVEVPEQPGEDNNKKKKMETKQRGDKGFIEGW